MWIVAIGAATAAVAMLAVAFATGGGPAAGLCPRSVQNFAEEPYPAPALRDGDVLQVGDERSLQVSRLDIRGDGVIEQDRTVFEWTERRCGRDIDGYTFVVVRAVGPGEATVVPPSPRPGLRVRVDG